MTYQAPALLRPAASSAAGPSPKQSIAHGRELGAFVLMRWAPGWAAVALIKINTLKKKIIKLFSSIMNSVPFKCDSG